MDDIVFQPTPSQSTEFSKSETNETDGLAHSPKRDRLSAALLISFVFILPIFFIPFPGTQLQSAKTVLAVLAIALTFALIIARRLRDGVIEFPKTGIAFAMILLAAVVSAAAFISSSTTGSLFGLGSEVDTASFIIAGALLFFVSALALRTRFRVFAIFGAIFGAFMVTIVFHSARLLFGVDTFSFGYFNTTVASIVGKWNDLGAFAGLIALISLLSIELFTRARLLRSAFTVLLIAALFILVMVNFSTVWFLLALGASFVGLFLFIRARRHSVDTVSIDSSGENTTGVSRALPVASIAVLLVSLVFIVGGNATDAYISSLFDTSFIEARPAWESTLSVAGDTLRKEPLFGAGPNRFLNQWLLYKPDNINETPFWSVDFNLAIGIIPTFLVTTGAVGAIAWVILLGAFIMSGFRSLRRLPEDPVAIFLLLSTLLGALYLWAIAFFYIPNAVLFGLAFLFTGLFVAVLVQEGLVRDGVLAFARDSRTSFITSVVLIVLVLGGVTGGVMQTRRALASAYFGRALYAVQNESNDGRGEEYAQKAIQVNKQFDSPYRLLSELHLNHLVSILALQDFDNPDAQQRMQTQLAQAILFARTATEADPTHYQNWSMLGNVYGTLVPIEVEGAYESAKASFEKAIVVNPTNPALYFSLARLEAAHGNMAGAREYISKALELKSNYSAAVFFLSQIEVAEGNLPAAIASAEEAARLSSEDPVAFFQLGLLYYNNKDFKGAAEALEYTINLQPVYANARYFLGLAYYELGLNKEAIAQFEEIERSNAENAEIKLILENLRTGRSPFFGGEDLAPPIDDTPTEREELPLEESVEE